MTTTSVVCGDCSPTGRLTHAALSKPSSTPARNERRLRDAHEPFEPIPLLPMTRLLAHPTLRGGTHCVRTFADACSPLYARLVPRAFRRKFSVRLDRRRWERQARWQPVPLLP